MKRLSLLILAFALLSTTACQSYDEPSSEAIQTMAPVGSEMKEEFGSIDEFVSAINGVSSPNSRNTHDDAARRFDVEGLEQILMPIAVEQSDGIESIQVDSNSIAFMYSTEQDTDFAGLPIIVVWHRDITSDVLLSVFPMPDARNSWTFERNGVTFYVDEMGIMGEAELTGFYVRWDYNGMAYSANVPVTYSENDIADLTNYDNILTYSE